MELTLHIIIIAHHHGYRPVVISRGLPLDVVDALQATNHHQYFIDRSLDEKYGAVKFRSFPLSVGDKRYHILSRLEMVADVVTHRGNVSLSQFYIIDPEQQNLFENEFKFNAPHLIAQIPFINMNLTVLRKDQIEYIDPLQQNFIAEDTPILVGRMRNKLNESQLRTLFSNTTFNALDNEKKLVVYSPTFSNSIDLFSTYCRGFIAALPVCYRKYITFSTAEFVPDNLEYNVIFLHSESSIKRRAANPAFVIVNLDSGQPNDLKLWYLSLKPTDTNYITKRLCYISDRVQIRNIDAILQLEAYYNIFSDNTKLMTIDEFKEALTVIEKSIDYINLSKIIEDVEHFLCTVSNTESSIKIDYQQCLDSVALSLAEGLERNSKSSIIQRFLFICSYVEIARQYNYNTSISNEITRTFLNMHDSIKVNIARQLIQESRYAPIVYSLFLTGLNITHLTLKEYVTIVQPFITALRDSNLKNPITVRIALIRELLINSGIIESSKRQIESNNSIIRYSSPVFDQYISSLSENEKEQFFENMCYVLTLHKEPRGIVVPVLWSYLIMAPNSTASNACYKSMMTYIYEQIKTEFQYALYRKLSSLCTSIIDYFVTLCNQPDTEEYFTVFQQAYTNEPDYKFIILQLAAATANIESRMKMLMDEIVKPKFTSEEFKEIESVLFKHYIKYLPEDAKSSWFKILNCHSME